jgi:hypothetical protein
MEVTWEDSTRWFRNSPEWRKEVSEAFGLENHSWKLNHPSQEWIDAPVELLLCDEPSSSESSDDSTPLTGDISSTPNDSPQVELTLDVDADGKVMARLEIRKDLPPTDAQRTRMRKIRKKRRQLSKH